MDDAASARDAACEVLGDIEPPRLRELLRTRIRETAATPGALTRMSARAAGGPDATADLDRRVAGVQLIYEGLSLTRSVARAPPWDHDATSEADMDVLVANVLVARGFYLLARTEAADVAVECVRAFGRDETAAEGESNTEPGALEADIFELAIVAGASAVGVSHLQGSRAFAADLAESLPDTDHGLPEETDEALEMLVAGEGPVNAAQDGIEASSATDL